MRSHEEDGGITDFSPSLSSRTTAARQQQSTLSWLPLCTTAKTNKLSCAVSLFNKFRRIEEEQRSHKNEIKQL